jgi:hypothetical protein
VPVAGGAARRQEPLDLLGRQLVDRDLLDRHPTTQVRPQLQLMAARRARMTLANQLTVEPSREAAQRPQHTHSRRITAPRPDIDNSGEKAPSAPRGYAEQNRPITAQQRTVDARRGITTDAA